MGDYLPRGFSQEADTTVPTEHFATRTHPGLHPSPRINNSPIPVLEPGAVLTNLSLQWILRIKIQEHGYRSSILSTHRGTRSDRYQCVGDDARASGIHPSSSALLSSSSARLNLSLLCMSAVTPAPRSRYLGLYPLNITPWTTFRKRILSLDCRYQRGW